LFPFTILDGVINQKTAMLRRFYENKTENDKFHVTGSGEHDKGVKA
jgi:hypothetical protein